MTHNVKRKLDGEGNPKQPGTDLHPLARAAHQAEKDPGKRNVGKKKDKKKAG